MKKLVLGLGLSLAILGGTYAAVNYNSADVRTEVSDDDEKKAKKKKKCKKKCSKTCTKGETASAEGSKSCCSKSKCTKKEEAKK